MRKRIRILCTTLALTIFMSGSLGHLIAHAQEEHPQNNNNSTAENTLQPEGKDSQSPHEHQEEPHAEQEDSQEKKSCSNQSEHEDEVPLSHIGALSRNPIKENKREKINGHRSILLQVQRKNIKVHKGCKRMKSQTRSRSVHSGSGALEQQEHAENDDEEDPE